MQERPGAGRPVIALDIESTGTNPETDRIIDLALAAPGGRCVVFRVNPGVPIPPRATAVHGIRDEDVRSSPSFAEVAPRVQAWVEGAILLGYNSRSFDVPLLHAELRRAGQPGLDLDALPEIDVYRLWSELEPRTLAGAARRWLGRDHAEAHGAREDARVALEVWARMRDAFGLSVDDAVRLTRPAHELDRAGKFVVNARHEVVFNFGKHQGKPVSSVDPSYLEWVAAGEFPPSTKALVQRLILHQGDLPEAAALRARR